VSAVAAALGVSRPHLSSRQRTAPRRRGRPPLPDAGLVAATLVRRPYVAVRQSQDALYGLFPTCAFEVRALDAHGKLLYQSPKVEREELRAHSSAASDLVLDLFLGGARPS
jgi:putative transposase